MELPYGIECPPGRKPFNDATWHIECKPLLGGFWEGWRPSPSEPGKRWKAKKDAIAKAIELKKDGFGERLRIVCGWDELH